MPLSEQSVGELLAADHQFLDGHVHELIADFHISKASTTFARLDLFWACLAMHIRAENLHVFPAILKALDANVAVQGDEIYDRELVRETLITLRRDHDFFMHELGCAVNLLRDFLKATELNGVEAPDDVREIIFRVTERLIGHNRLEEELVYGLAEGLLSAEDKVKLAAEVRRELDNLPPRFSTGWQISRGLSDNYDGG